MISFLVWLKIGSVVFEKKNEIFANSSKIFQRVAKKKLTNPIHFHNNCCFEIGPNTSQKQTSTICY